MSTSEIDLMFSAARLGVACWLLGAVMGSRDPNKRWFRTRLKVYPMRNVTVTFATVQTGFELRDLIRVKNRLALVTGVCGPTLHCTYLRWWEYVLYFCRDQWRTLERLTQRLGTSE